MEIGILGAAQSGKSTLFQIMTGHKGGAAIFEEGFISAMASVPDGRFDRLVDIFKPKKVTPATVAFVDTCTSGEETKEKVRSKLQTADGLIFVVDAFTENNPVKVAQNFKNHFDDLILQDLVTTENRIERLAKLGKAAIKPEEKLQSEIFPQCKVTLEAGKPISSMKLSPEQENALRGFSLWTIKPVLVCVNCSEGNLAITEGVAKALDAPVPVIGISCQAELEISELPKADRREFLDSMGIKEPAFEKIIRQAFLMTGRMFYFTVGEDEVRAWVIPSKSTAPRAAAAIHKDFERGFIKAEVASFDEFMANGGTLAAVKAAGKLRLEGKDYIVKDGDIISFRFNV